MHVQLFVRVQDRDSATLSWALNRVAEPGTTHNCDCLENIKNWRNKYLVCYISKCVIYLHLFMLGRYKIGLIIRE